jgi:hypothetical protein
MQALVYDDVAYIVPFYPQVAQAYRHDRFSGWPQAMPRLALESRRVLAGLRPLPVPAP